MSADVAVGGTFNIAQYALLLLMIAQVSDMEAYEFIWSIGDAHIYLDQIDLVKEQLKRDPLPLPQIKLNPHIDNLFEFVSSDIELVNYKYHPVIKYPISV